MNNNNNNKETRLLIGTVIYELKGDHERSRKKHLRYKDLTIEAQHMWSLKTK